MAVRGAPAKGVGRVTGAEVRIFSTPPNKKDRFYACLFYLATLRERTSLHNFVENEVRKRASRRWELAHVSRAKFFLQRKKPLRNSANDVRTVPYPISKVSFCNRLFSTVPIFLAPCTQFHSPKQALGVIVSTPPKNSTSFDLSNFFIHRESNGISSRCSRGYHHRRCISSAVGCIFFRNDDIQGFRLGDIQNFVLMIYTPLA